MAALALLPRTAPAAEDALLGKWLGTAGSAKEKIEVGLEFRRNAEGKLAILTTQPIANLFGTDMGGEVLRDGDTVSSAAMFLNLRLHGDTLSGTYPGPNSPATFKRVRTLPLEPALPRLPTGPAPRWEARLSGQVYASPVVADGVAYIGTTGGILNAIDVRDGKPRWAFSAGRPIHGAVAVTADSVYFAADNGFLFCLARADGKERWRYTLGDAAVTRVLPHPFVYDWDWQGAQPVVAGDTVYIGAGDGGLHAVDAASGQKRWRFDTRGRIRNAVALAEGKVYVGSADHFVYALDAASGRELWRSDTGAEVDAAPVVHAGRVLAGNRGAGLLSLDAASGETHWRLFFWGSWVESTPVVRDGVIYVGSSDLRRVSAINPADGHVLWRSDVFGWNWGTPLVTDKYIYVGAAGGTPYFIRHQASFSVLERSSGRLLTRWPLADTGGHQWGIAGSPALAGDSVIVATIAGSLLAFPLQP
ncbi:outer membrane protein assembly factor BamB family protein [Tahibacter harae]|uniref:PQQ-binding-like beta-propeller repeat protein n=1 Tax=Tahibacter harae TaxID=2963937 RepID=A0ABT1QV22_9GAMM|nr:PQQ-binding-like beta-propeller repeat protein [Tahibacter harae]MCQ4166139.1 PQQ-binding-like beta-propeller repeat protein [Tahibacter harae]